MMAVGQTGRKKIILPQTVHPEYRQVIETLLSRLKVQLVAVPFDDGQIDQGKLAEVLDAETAAVVVQYPNFFGCLEELESISRLTKNVNALLIVSAYPIALGMLTPPGEMGADIVTGEGQSLGAPLGFGGPYLGFIAAKTSLLRKMPGRIAGCTQDTKGRRGFVLTLQAREQHIRREKATSNICSNQALMALNATIYLSLVGAEGLRDIAYQSFQKAHYLKRELGKIPSLTFPFSVPFFNEFVVKIPEARKNLDKLAKKGIFAGVPLDRWYSNLKDHVLIAVTEKRTVEEMNRFVELLGGMLS
jgi:glycine dehydrogenase subunit 1